MKRLMKKSSMDVASVRSKESWLSMTLFIRTTATVPAKSSVESGQKITKNIAEQICTSGLSTVEVMPEMKNSLIFNSLAEDPTGSHEEALLRDFQHLRPGNPPQLERARLLFHEKFYDTNRYRLGKVGRFRINRKLATTYLKLK